MLERDYSSLNDFEKSLGSTMAYLEEHKIIDDKRLALTIASQQTHKGDRFIKNVLQQRKISDTLITRVLAEIPDEYTRAQEEINKKFTGINPPPFSSALALRFLAGRHFADKTIKDVVQHVSLKPTNTSRNMAGSPYNTWTMTTI